MRKPTQSYDGNKALEKELENQEHIMHKINSAGLIDNRTKPNKKDTQSELVKQNNLKSLEQQNSSHFVYVNAQDKTLKKKSEDDGSKLAKGSKVSVNEAIDITDIQTNNKPASNLEKSNKGTRSKAKSSASDSHIKISSNNQTKFKKDDKNVANLEVEDMDKTMKINSKNNRKKSPIEKEIRANNREVHERNNSKLNSVDKNVSKVDIYSRKTDNKQNSKDSEINIVSNSASSKRSHLQPPTIISPEYMSDKTIPKHVNGKDMSLVDKTEENVTKQKISHYQANNVSKNKDNEQNNAINKSQQVLSGVIKPALPGNKSRDHKPRDVRINKHVDDTAHGNEGRSDNVKNDNNDNSKSTMGKQISVTQSHESEVKSDKTKNASNAAKSYNVHNPKVATEGVSKSHTELHVNEVKPDITEKSFKDVQPNHRDGLMKKKSHNLSTIPTETIESKTNSDSTLEHKQASYNNDEEEVGGEILRSNKQKLTSNTQNESSGSGNDDETHPELISLNELTRSVRNIDDENTRNTLVKALEKDEKKMQKIANEIKMNYKRNKQPFRLSRVLRDLVTKPDNLPDDLDEDDNISKRSPESDKTLVRVKRVKTTRPLRGRGGSQDVVLKRFKRIDTDSLPAPGSSSDKTLIRVKRKDLESADGANATTTTAKDNGLDSEEHRLPLKNNIDESKLYTGQIPHNTINDISNSNSKLRKKTQFRDHVTSDLIKTLKIGLETHRNGKLNAYNIKDSRSNNDNRQHENVEIKDHPYKVMQGTQNGDKELVRVKRLDIDE